MDYRQYWYGRSDPIKDLPESVESDLEGLASSFHPGFSMLSFNDLRYSVHSIVASYIVDIPRQIVCNRSIEAIWQTFHAVDVRGWAQSLHLQSLAQSRVYIKRLTCYPLLWLSFMEVKRSLNAQCCPSRFALASLSSISISRCVNI